MEIVSMTHFQERCRQKFINKYRQLYEDQLLFTDTFVVWACDVLQNYRCVVSAKNCDNNLFAEFIYDRNSGQLNIDLYEKKLSDIYE